MFRLKLLLVSFATLMAAGSWGAYTIHFEKHPQLAHLDDGSVARMPANDMAHCFQAKQKSWSKPNARASWTTCQQHLTRYGAIDEFNSDFALMHALGAGALAAFAALFGIAWLQKPPARHVRGPKVLRGPTARRSLSKSLRQECHLSGNGIDLVPGIKMSRDRESRHIMITGGVGSGKTQMMRHLILGAMKRGDHTLVLDTKGDMTRGLPGDIVLLAPQDERSAAWAVAKDCISKQDARELAARFIPKSDDPMWSEAARSILVACIVSLQKEKPGEWTWANLYSRTIMEPEVLKCFADKYHPAASQLLADPTSKTAMSILTTFKAHLPTIEALADAWGGKGDKAFPISKWLQETEGTVPVVLQRDGRYPELSNAWISGLISLLSSYVSSAALEESTKRRIWLFLDEFPQLEKMDEFATLLDLGRSKGVCVVLAAQDTAQIRARYGRDRTNAWFSMVGTHIVTRMNVGEGAADISRALGLEEIEISVPTTSYSGGRYSKSTSVLTRTRPVMTASEISSELGPRRDAIRVLMIGIGQHYHLVDVPYCPFEDERDPHNPAQWTRAELNVTERNNPLDAQTVGLLSDVDVMAILDKKKRGPDEW